jgi:hypothetical protein
MIGDVARSESLRNVVPKHAFTRYCWLKTLFFVKCTALFREEAGRTGSDPAEIDAEIQSVCDGLVEGRLGQ